MLHADFTPPVFVLDQDEAGQFLTVRAPYHFAIGFDEMILVDAWCRLNRPDLCPALGNMPEPHPTEIEFEDEQDEDSGEVIRRKAIAYKVYLADFNRVVHFVAGAEKLEMEIAYYRVVDVLGRRPVGADKA